MDTQKLSSIVSDRRVILIAASASSLAAGCVSGYFLAHSKLQKQFDERLEKEIAETRKYYSEARLVQVEKPSPQEVLADSIIEEEGYSGKDFAPPAVTGDTLVSSDGTIMTTQVQGDPISEQLIDDSDPETAAALQEDVEGRVRQNVFDGREPAEEEWDYEAELRIRAENPDKPYILHHDEYYENETEFEQATLTYYEGDDTLVDEKDVPVPDEDATVGEDALTAFGHGSKDKNVVFVRNDKLEMDFEIVRSNGKFSVEVLGFDDQEESELRHSYSRPGRKFRMGHDD